MAKKKNASLGKHAAKSASDNKQKAAKDENLTQSESMDRSETGVLEEVTAPVAAAESEGDVEPSSVEESASRTVKSIEVGSAANSSFTFQEESKKKRKGLKICGITSAVMLAVLVIVYGVGCFAFTDRFFPHTVIGSHDISMQTITESAPQLDAAAGEYSVTIQGKTKPLVFTAEELNLTFDGQKIVQNAHARVVSWMWPIEVFKNHDLSDQLLASYDSVLVDKAITVLVEEYNAEAIAPKNAQAVFDKKTQKFAIIPEEDGTTLDKQAVLTKIDRSISTLAPQAIISEEEYEQPTIFSTSEELIRACKEADELITADISLALAGTELVIIDPAQQSKWVTFDKDLRAKFNEDAFEKWIDKVVAGLNTIGTERTYKRPDGKEITVSGGTYGWEIDSENLRKQIKKGMADHLVGKIEIPVTQEGNGFTKLGGQDWGKRYVDIDLTEQHARFYNEKGKIIWESDIISGKPNGQHNTPTGAYMVNSKASPSKLVGEPLPGQKKPEYETWVTYWMPFVGNSVGLHDATWQPGFGGSMYANGYGSHGCVNLPYYAAEELYGLVHEGDPVICHW